MQETSNEKSTFFSSRRADTLTLKFLILWSRSLTDFVIKKKLFLVVLESFGRCFTPDQYRGDCVYFKSCPPLLEIFNRRPPSTNDRLFLSLSQCGYRDGQPLVCCREFAPPPPPPTQPPPPQNIVTQAPIVPQQPSLLPKPGECGIDAENRIYGGNVTTVDEYPW